MVVGKSSIIDAIRSGGLKYWKLYGSNGTDLITGTDSPDNEDLTLTDSVSQFEKWLGLIGTGSFVLVGWQKPKQLKDRAKIRFEIPVEGLGGISSSNFNIPDGLSEDKVQEAVNKAVAEYKREEELKNLKDRVQELEAENRDLNSQIEGAQNQILGRLAPYIDPLMKGLGFETPVNGQSIAGNENAANGDEFQVRLEKAFDTWLSVESGNTVIELVEKIATMAVDNTQKYELAKSMI